MSTYVCESHDGDVVVYHGAVGRPQCPLCSAEREIQNLGSQIDAADDVIAGLKDDIADLNNQITDTLAGENL